MGMSDPFLIPEISPHISHELNKLKNGSKVAWLGQIHPLSNKSDAMYKAIMNNVKVQINSDFYDLYNDPNIADNSYVWDVNSEWNFAGYDLIVAVRIFYACTSASQLLRNLKKVVLSDQRIIGDLMSGNNQNFEDINNKDLKKYIADSTNEPDKENKTVSAFYGEDGAVRVYNHSTMVINGFLCEIFTKPKDSKAIIPMLPTIWKNSKINSGKDVGYANNLRFIAMPNFEDQTVEERDFSNEDIGLTNIYTFRDALKKRIYSICEFSDES